MMGHDRARVLVPRRIGMEIAPAYRIALLSGIALCGQDPDRVLPLRGVINDQQPTAGTLVWSGDPVTVSVSVLASSERAVRARPGQDPARVSVVGHPPARRR